MDNFEKQLSDMKSRQNELSKFTREQGTQIAEIRGDIKTLLKTVEFLEKKLNDHSEITKGVHNMALSVEKYAQKVDTLATTMGERMNIFEGRQSEHGKRIGELEKKPGEKALQAREKIIWLVLTPIFAAIGGIIAGFFIGGGS